VEQDIRVVLVDDHEVVRAGLKSLLDLQEGITVVGEASTAAEGVRRVGYDSPDVVVLDVRLPDASGVEACRDIKQRWPEVAVLMLTSYADEQALVAAVMAGAAGYLLKRVDSDALVDAIRRAAAGESLLDPEATRRLVEKVRRRRDDDPLLARLSTQERRILDLIAEGKTNRQIADELFLAEKTVKNYVSNMLAKLGMKRRAEAAAYVARVETRQEHQYPPEDWEEGAAPGAPTKGPTR